MISELRRETENESENIESKAVENDSDMVIHWIDNPGEVILHTHLNVDADAAFSHLVGDVLRPEVHEHRAERVEVVEEAGGGADRVHDRKER